ncbi:hypothetical protein [Fulvivirga sedimenti]|uniref:Uncharacterized protein n=1 Tax=Fulvivirga sedimenti TaxID=2879465 RepID=A0A9X1HR08_9BACT|nr:hypothetical protein [Fulvivirga sedimenti]MCA6075640.1 hypothetical protein [Fulvivirga sedimenti]
MKEYYQDDSARIYYDRELNALFLEYTGRVKNEEHFIQINTAVLNAFRELDTHKFVADIRKMGVISLNSQRWVVDVLLPGMMDHLKGKKLYHAQLLDPSEVFSKVSAGNIRNKSTTVDTGFEVHQFSDESVLREQLAANA